MFSRMPPSCATPEAGIHEHQAELEGHRMRFLHGGSGAPLLLVHGLLGYSFSWRFNLPALAKRFTVFAPDLLGAGFSERVPGMDCSMAAIAGRLLQFLQGQGIESFDLLGTSHGGAIAMMLAALATEHNPSAVRRLVLVDPAHPWSRPRPVLIKLLSQPAGAALFRAFLPAIRLTHEHYLRRMYGDPRRIPPGTAEGYKAPLANPNAYEYPLCIVRCWRDDMRKLEAVLPKIAAIPTLLMWGSQDRVISPHSAPQLQRQFRNCRLLMLDGVGHLPYEETPEEFNRAVLNFLEAD
ncbi:MAG TPA: alpha/beta fold hydrolase [Terriglobales bacterium]|jgi:pimeloyl-ACP methyl ester carboxylesterase|nr:alpha/beta fold hydrolase [Terriglobales bacterium]